MNAQKNLVGCLHCHSATAGCLFAIALQHAAKQALISEPSAISKSRTFGMVKCLGTTNVQAALQKRACKSKRASQYAAGCERVSTPFRQILR